MKTTSKLIAIVEGLPLEPSTPADAPPGAAPAPDNGDEAWWQNLCNLATGAMQDYADGSVDLVSCNGDTAQIRLNQTEDTGDVYDATVTRIEGDDGPDGPMNLHVEMPEYYVDRVVLASGEMLYLALSGDDEEDDD